MKIIFILLLSLALRLYKINTPLADWHSWRQSDTASVANEFVKHGINLLEPTYQDISSIPSGKDNPMGYRMVEFPIINALAAFIYKFSFVNKLAKLHVVYRLIDVLLSLISTYLIYAILKELESEKIGLLGALFFAILPYNIFYSRGILPEVGMVTFVLLSIYAAAKDANKHSRFWFLISIFSASLSLLIKPVAIFFLLPVLPLLVTGISKLHRRFYERLVLLISSGVLVVLPMVLWRLWIKQFPEGVPASDWLMNGNGIRFKGAFFQWIFGERIGQMILGGWGLIPLALGLLVNKKSKLSTWLLSGTLFYLFIFATGNVQHDYYQIPIIPIIAILLAYGSNFLLDNKAFNKAASYLLFTVSFLLSISLSWYQIRGFYNINNPAIVAAGKAVDSLTEPGSLIIAPYGGDTAFLYQTNRQGWPIGGNIEDKINKGAAYYVTTTLDSEAKDLISKYSVISQTDQYSLIKLK